MELDIDPVEAQRVVAFGEQWLAEKGNKADAVHAGFEECAILNAGKVREIFHWLGENAVAGRVYEAEATGEPPAGRLRIEFSGGNLDATRFKLGFPEARQIGG